MNYPEKELSQAHLNLMFKFSATAGFIANFALKLIYEWDEKILTASTDGKIVKINPTFFLGLSPEVRVSLITHEAWHVALMHVLPERKGTRCIHKWNYAGDYVINLMLRDSGMYVPDTWLIDSKYRNMSTEEIYEVLPDMLDMPEFLDVEPSKSSSESSEELLKNKIENDILKSHIESKMDNKKYSSTGCPHLDKFIDKILNPKINWKSQLMFMASEMKKEDYSYRRPKKQFLPEFYLPSIYSEGFGDVQIYIDTSGSICDKEFSQFIAECHEIFLTVNPTNMEVFCWGSGIVSQENFKNVHELKNAKFCSGGGTRIASVFNSIINTKPKVAIIFTDGYFSAEKNLELLASRASKVIYVIFNNDKFTSDNIKTIKYTLSD